MKTGVAPARDRASLVDQLTKARADIVQIAELVACSDGADRWAIEQAANNVAQAVHYLELQARRVERRAR